MLTNAKVHPTLPVVDFERAKKFYEETLGLKVIMEDPSPGALLQAGEGTNLYIYQRAATKADHTVAGFSVKDVEATVIELKAKGVVFEDVDVPGLKTVESIVTMATPAGEYKGAWFKDTEGNILSIGNMQIRISGAMSAYEDNMLHMAWPYSSAAEGTEVGEMARKVNTMRADGSESDAYPISRKTRCLFILNLLFAVTILFPPAFYLK